MKNPVPEGYHVAGVSTLYDLEKGTARHQWVKSRIDADHKFMMLRDAALEIADEMPRAEPFPAQKDRDGDLLCVYPMGDPHLGMYAWHCETGADFNLEIAERNLVTAVDHLVSVAPPAKQALVINLGDFFHADNSSNRTTRSNNVLDVDTRYPKVLATGIRVMKRIIDRALEKHETVRVICEIGNHDDHSAFWLALLLNSHYERCDRVTIDTSPAKFHWYRFGKVLIGTTHGNDIKPQALQGVMATDRAKDWGETNYRYWYCGHVHHESVKDYRGCTVETFRTLAAPDAYHARSGYRSERDMRVDVIHKEWGKKDRHIVGIRQIWKLQENRK